MKLTMEIIKRLILEQISEAQKFYTLEECSIYVVEQGEIVFLPLYS